MAVVWNTGDSVVLKEPSSSVNPNIAVLSDIDSDFLWRCTFHDGIEIRIPATALDDAFLKLGPPGPALERRIGLPVEVIAGRGTGLIGVIVNAFLVDSVAVTDAEYVLVRLDQGYFMFVLSSLAAQRRNNLP